MIGRSPASRGDSGGGWSDDGAGDLATEARAGTDDDHPFRIDAAGRYREVELIGRGGMGQVLVARDRRLGRDVALKRIAASADAPELAARLAREARVTAVLEHPSIIAVYDAGVGGDGRLYYTMRLVHGRSLAEVAAGCGGPQERLRLLRPFLAVCEAIGYAHSVGVVHRDLKPANIMVGGFGETQVVDWGLAAFSAGAPPELRDEALPLGDRRAAVGTPGYMSPEQAAGDDADPRADVWSLGVILRELVTGARPAAAAATEDRTGEDGAPLPAELAAIVAKATATLPDERYPDAGAMAADVARFLDGRRVEAHAYTTGELVRRLLWRLRVPLALAATALVVTTIAVAVSFQRIDRARGQAVTAEAAARAALADARRTSARALTGQALADLDRGAVAEAGVLAARSLELDDTADARGAVAAALASPRPTHAESVELPDCLDVTPGTWTVAVCREADAIALWDLQPRARRWRVPFRGGQLAVLAPVGLPMRVVALERGAATLWLLDARDGSSLVRFPLEVRTGVADHLEVAYDDRFVAVTDGQVVNVIALDDRAAAATAGRPCASRPVAALGPAAHGFAAACSDGSTWLFDGDGVWRPGPSITGPVAANPYALARSPDGAHLAVVSLGGDVVELEVATGLVTASMDTGIAGLARVAYLPTTPRSLLVGSDTVGAVMVELARGVSELRLPDATVRHVRVVGDRVLTGGSHAGRWILPAQPRPRTLRAPAGLAGVAVTGDGRWLAAARGDGLASLWDGRTGALVRTVETRANGALKAVAFSPDGTELALSRGPDGQAPAVFDVASGQAVPYLVEPKHARRLAYLADGTLVAARFSRGPSLYRRGRPPLELDGPEMLDLTVTPDRRQAVLLAIDGTVYAIVGDTLVAGLRVPGATTVAAWDEGRSLAASDAGVIEVRAAGRPPARLDSVERVLDLAVSPDERYLLAARVDGTIAVWRLADLHPIAVFRGHRQRVSHLAFTDDGRVVSASWDGSLMSWDLRALDAAPAALVAELHAAWGLDLSLPLPR